MHIFNRRKFLARTTADHRHALPAVMACQAGLDVYVEKPLGKTIDEGREATQSHRTDGFTMAQLPAHSRRGRNYSLRQTRQGQHPAHVRNFLDCMKSRKQPVLNLEAGHHVSTLAHLGNIAYRTGRKIVWDGATEKNVGDHEADRLVGVHYHKPWHLPHLRRA